MEGDLLLTNQHPSTGENARLTHDHEFRQLLAGKLGGGQDGGLVGDLPDGVVDGYVFLLEHLLNLINQRHQLIFSNCNSTSD